MRTILDIKNTDFENKVQKLDESIEETNSCKSDYSNDKIYINNQKLL